MDIHVIRRISLSVLAAIGVGAVPALAQDPLSLEDAIARGLRQNPSIRAANAAQREAEERTRQARAIWLPRVDVTESWQRGNQPVFVFGSLLAQRQFTQEDFQLDRLNHPDPMANFRTGLSVEQVVFDGTRTTAAVRSAKIAADMAGAGTRDAASAVRVAVTEAYGAVLMAAARRKAADSALASADEDARRVERRRDAGLATEADVLALQVHLAQVRTRLISATSDETIARARLNEAMGEPLDRAFLLAPALPPTPEPVILADLETEALNTRPDVQQALDRERLAREALESARGGFLPQAALQGVWEANGGSFADRASSWTVGAVFRWNVFAGLSDSARVGEAKAGLERARADRDRQEARIRVDVRTAVARATDARARETVAGTAVAQARESQRIVRDRYDAGLASLNDLLRSANAVLDAEFQHTAAAVDVLVSAAMLDRARGR